MSGHKMKVRLDHDAVILSLVCEEGPGSDCHKGCVRGCEEECTGGEDHIGDLTYCLAAEWLNNYDPPPDEAYDSEKPKCDLPLYDGMPVEVRWNSFNDCWVWKVAEGSND
jgi:hypothetical protein